jgi:GTPase SAR1 family protein
MLDQLRKLWRSKQATRNCTGKKVSSELRDTTKAPPIRSVNEGAMREIKVLMVGQDGVGKTCLITRVSNCSMNNPLLDEQADCALFSTLPVLSVMKMIPVWRPVIANKYVLTIRGTI